MKLTVSCQTCGRILSTCEKDDISLEDMSSSIASSACEVDGPFQQSDEEGTPLPMDRSNIIAVRTLE